MARSFSWLDPVGGANKQHHDIRDTQKLWAKESGMQGHSLIPFDVCVYECLGEGREILLRAFG